jgi:hypothetical protein
MITADEALAAINELRSNIVGTQSASWSNTMYPLVAILDAAGMEVFEPSVDQMAEHISCYGGAGGYPGMLRAEPDYDAKLRAQNIYRNKQK